MRERVVREMTLRSLGWWKRGEGVLDELRWSLSQCSDHLALAELVNTSRGQE